jgi:hypothetical protein
LIQTRAKIEAVEKYDYEMDPLEMKNADNVRAY